MANSAASKATNFCVVDFCGGEVGVFVGDICIVCGADVHPKCFQMTVRRYAKYPVSCHNEIFGSDTCCLLYSKSEVNFEEVKKERNELLKNTFKDLSKMAKDAKVTITTHIDNKSRNLPKHVVIRILIHKKFIGSDSASTSAASQVKLYTTDSGKPTLFSMRSAAQQRQLVLMH